LTTGRRARCDHRSGGARGGCGRLGIDERQDALALRLAAEAQASGSIVAYLDLARSFDPVEAVARGVRLEWLVVLTPESIDDGLAMAGSLVQGRAIDLLPSISRVVDRGRGRMIGVARRAVARSVARAVVLPRLPTGSIGSPPSPGTPTRCSSSSNRPISRRAFDRRSGSRPASAWSSPVGHGSGSAGTSSANGRR
jgi:hypothetical protein